MTPKEQYERVGKQILWGNITGWLFAGFMVAETIVLVFGIRPLIYPEGIRTMNEYITFIGITATTLYITLSGGMFLNFLVDKYLL